MSSRSDIAAVGPFADGSRSPRIGLALAGGAPEGAVYEIGALRALEEALDGLENVANVVETVVLKYA